MRKVSISASPNHTCKLCVTIGCLAASQWRPKQVYFTLDVVHINLRTQPFMSDTHLWAATGCWPLLSMEILWRQPQAQPEHSRGMRASCQASLCKHPSWRWQADETSNRAGTEPAPKPLRHCGISVATVIHQRIVLWCSAELFFHCCHTDVRADGWVIGYAWSFITQSFAQALASWFGRVLAVQVELSIKSKSV